MFRKFDDLYPLTDFEGNRTQNEITGPDGKSNSSLKDPSIDRRIEMHPQSAIKVKQDWDVESDDAISRIRT